MHAKQLQQRVLQVSYDKSLVYGEVRVDEYTTVNNASASRARYINQMKDMVLKMNIGEPVDVNLWETYRRWLKKLGVTIKVIRKA